MNCDQLTRATQIRLKQLGYYSGYLDGDVGVMTNNAIIDFKSNNGLLPRDFVGPITLGRLFGDDAKARPELKGSTAWLKEARRLLGTREFGGSANNPEIMGWASDLDQWYPGDDVPWCGLFMAHCMAVGAPNEPQDFNRLGARNWMEYGEDAGPAPKLGAIAPMWRTHKTKSWNGHVILITGYNATHVRGIGGNQSDMVSEQWFTRERVLGYRQPTGAKLEAAPRARTGKLSVRED